ncbi:MAG: hypothetical protein R3A13_09530 [Bdellovibrionota bacterium]
MQKFIQRFLLLLGLLLLSFNVYGLLIQPLVRNGEVVYSKYHYRLITPEAAISEFENLKKASLSDKEKLEKLLDLVSSSYIHYDQRYKLQPWDNWIFWAYDFAYRLKTNFTRFLPFPNSDLLWRRGAGLCSQAAYIYSDKARELGYQSRMIMLTEHVVAEVFLADRGWLVVDPDYGVFWNATIEELRKKYGEVGISQKIVELGFETEIAEALTKIYLNNPWKIDNRDFKDLKSFELRTRIWIWIIPLCLILLALCLKWISKLKDRSP